MSKKKKVIAPGIAQRGLWGVFKSYLTRKKEEDGKKNYSYYDFWDDDDYDAEMQRLRMYYGYDCYDEDDDWYVDEDGAIIYPPKKNKIRMTANNKMELGTNREKIRTLTVRTRARTTPTKTVKTGKAIRGNLKTNQRLAAKAPKASPARLPRQTVRKNPASRQMEAQTTIREKTEARKATDPTVSLRTEPISPLALKATAILRETTQMNKKDRKTKETQTERLDQTTLRWDKGRKTQIPPNQTKVKLA